MQKVFVTYRENVESRPIGELHVGFLKPGRYNGFRKLTTVSGLTLSIGHDDPQTIKKNSGPYETFGAIVTTNGSIVHESEAIEVTLDTNVGNAETRFDILICEHVYATIVGGQPATYSVIKGPYDGTVPVLPNPEKQVIVGTFKLTPGAYNVGTGISYKPQQAKLPGDLTYEELFSNLVLPLATELQRGIARTSTQAEAAAGTNTETYITPFQLRKYGSVSDTVYISATDAYNMQDLNGKTAVFTGPGEMTIIIPENAGVDDFDLPANFKTRIVALNAEVKIFKSGNPEFLLPFNRIAIVPYRGMVDIVMVNPTVGLTKYIIRGDLKTISAL